MTQHILVINICCVIDEMNLLYLFAKPSTASTCAQQNQFELNVVRLNKMLQSVAGFPTKGFALCC